MSIVDYLFCMLQKYWLTRTLSAFSICIMFKTLTPISGYHRYAKWGFRVADIGIFQSLEFTFRNGPKLGICFALVAATAVFTSWGSD
jgi:hypothetical protein